MSIDEIASINPEALICVGFNDAIIGMVERFDLPIIVAYNVDKIISILIERDGMTYDEAYEFYEFNIKNAWVGENGPAFIIT